MFAYALASNLCSEATNIGYGLSLGAVFGDWRKIRIHVGEIWGFPERLWFFKHALVHQQINEILRIDTQTIIIISQQFYNNKPEFLFLLSPFPDFFQLICRIEIHRTLISCNLQKCALEQVQVADEQLGRSETKHFYRLQGRRVRLFISPTLQIRIFNQSGILCLAYSVQ